MIEYNELGIAVQNMPEHGVSFFSRKFQTGETMRIPSPVAATGPCPTAGILPEGTLQVINSLDSGNVQIIAGGPGHIYKDNIEPGIFDIEALADDTIYTCLAQYDPTLPTILNALKKNWTYSIKLESFAIDEQKTLLIYGSGHTTVLVCLYGSVLVNIEDSGQPAVLISAGETFEIPAGQMIKVVADPNATTFSEVAWSEDNP